MKGKLLIGVLSILLVRTACGSPEQQFRYNYTLSTTVPYDWRDTDPVYTPWVNNGELRDCTNWSPSVATFGKGTAFTQSATDCKQDQTRDRQNQEQDSRTGIIQKVGAPIVEARTIQASNSRNAIGILENWSAYDPFYTTWVDTNALYGCNSWSPDPSIYGVTTNFNQISNTCKTDQERQRQDREQEQYTEEVRNHGTPVKEQQTLTAQTASRSYKINVGTWANNGSPVSCNNWSPAASTVTIGQTFTQTATDCQQPQQRARSESYVDHKTGSSVAAFSVMQTQSITVSDTRSATGTKETWVASTPQYSAWANSGGVYGCTGWSPSPSSYTQRTQFNQTGTGCSINQTRSRQDQQMEATTGTVRNVGAPVVESQTVGGQSSSRTYLMDFGGWGDSGGYYSCSAWSPDASTVASGTAFTQSATCYINQTRGAAGYTLVNGSWAADPAVPYRTETTAITRGVTQAATGTKAMQECPAMSANYKIYAVYVNQNIGNTYWAVWGGTKIQIKYNKVTDYPTVTSGGYTYYNNSSTIYYVTKNGVPICRKPA